MHISWSLSIWILCRVCLSGPVSSQLWSNFCCPERPSLIFQRVPFCSHPKLPSPFLFVFFLIEEIITISERCPFDRPYEGRVKKQSSALWAVFQDMTFMLTFLCYEGLISESAIHCSPLTERLKDFLFCTAHLTLNSTLPLSAHDTITLTGWIKRCFQLQQAADTLYCQKYWSGHPLLMNRFDYFSNFYEYKS